MRLSCVPEIQRPDGIRLHTAFDHKGIPCEVVVLRMWEASTLKENLPKEMYSGSIAYHTAEYECISLDWASKELEEDPDLLKSQDSQQQIQTGEVERPLQDGYPVWYFLTGTISRPSKIKALWKLDQAPYARYATVHGLIKIQDRDYEGLVPCSDVDRYMNNTSALGVAYLAKSKLAENRLRYYKTSLFEVIRCKIKLHPLTDRGQEHEVDGLTFVVCSEEARTHQIAEPPIAEFLGAVGSGNEEPEERDLEPEERGVDPEEGSDKATSRDGNPEDDRPPFPVLKQGREGSASATSERRMMLLSPSRPRSSLMFVENAEDMSSSPGSATNHLEEDNVSDVSCSSEVIHGHCQPGSKAAFEEATPWWEQSLGVTTTSHNEASSSHIERPHTSDLSEDEGIWMVSGGGSGVSSTISSAMSTTPVDANQPLHELVQGRLDEHQGLTPDSDRTAVTVREISDIEAEIDDMADPGRMQLRFDSKGRQWPMPRGRSKSL
jgi:hypothetical protein